MYRVADIPSIIVDSEMDKQSPIVFRKKLRAMEVVSSVVTVVRTFGLFPSCLREVDKKDHETEDEPDVKCHRVIHIFLFVYSLFTSCLCLVFAISGLFYILLAKEVKMRYGERNPVAEFLLWTVHMAKENPSSYNFTLFDIILLWQASFLSLHCLFIGNRLKVYLNSLDAYFLSYQNVNLSKVELTATVIAFANQQTRNFRTYAQNAESENVHSSKDSVYKSSKKLCTALSVTSCLVVFCVIVQNIWSEMEDKDFTSPSVTVTRYISVKDSSKTWQTFFGTIVSCLSLLYNVLPQTLFVGCAIPLMGFVQNFNEKAEFSAQNSLDTDRVSEVHYKLRYLVRLLDDCFSSIIFTTILGDFCQLIFGTFLELMNCSLEGMDAKCSRYFARHIMLMLRLCLTIGAGVTLQERIQALLPTMEEYSSKSLLNTEKLKLLTLIQSLPTCGMSASSFFLITRNFVAKMVAVTLAYGVLLWKVSQD